MKKFIISHWPNLLILLFFILFIYIWGYWAWGESEVWSNGWKFDALGHAIFGFVLSFILLYLIKKYLFWIFVSPKIIVAFIIMAVVTYIEAQIWEGGELLWDNWLQPNFFSHLAKAQKGRLDTSADILITSYASFLAMILWWVYRKFFEWKWSNEAIQERIEEAAERAKLYSNEIRSMQIEHQKIVWSKIKSHWDGLWDSLR